MANSNLTRIFTITNMLVNSFVNYFEKLFQRLPPMVQIPLFPELDSKSDVSEAVEWVFVGQDHFGRTLYVSLKDPDKLLVNDVVAYLA